MSFLLIPFVKYLVLTALLLWLYTAVLLPLKKFKLSRAYLICLPLVALILSAIDWTQSFTPVAVGLNVGDANNVEEDPILGLNAQLPFSLLTWGYFTGLLVVLIRKVVQWRKIRDLFKITPITYQEAKVYPTKYASYFSLLGRVFVPSKDAQMLVPDIVRHEMLHVSYKHYWDILWCQLVQIAVWFNPIWKLWEYHLKNVHEFQVDQNFSQSDEDKLAYLNLIKDHVFYDSNQFEVAEYFLESNLKIRIQMMNSNRKLNGLKWTASSLFITVLISAFTLISPPNLKGKPLPEVYIKKQISGFGMRQHPITKEQKMHNGIDFVAPTGTPVYTIGDGVVVRAEMDGAYGNIVEIQHNATYHSRYAQLNELLVEKGDKVTVNQEIGTVGSTGRSTGPHLHFEVLENGKNIDPALILLP